MRVAGQAGDLPALELDRAVAGEINIAAQDSRRAESRAARGHVEERLVGAGAGEMDRPVLSSDAAVTLSDAESVALPMRERAAVGQRPRQGQARSAVAADDVETDVFRH